MNNLMNITRNFIDSIKNTYQILIVKSIKCSNYKKLNLIMLTRHFVWFHQNALHLVDIIS